MANTAPGGSPLLRAIDALVAGLGRASAWLCLAMAVLVGVVVVVRRMALGGNTALQDGVLYLHAAAVSVALAYTWQLGGHVQVDVLSRRYPEAGLLWQRVLGTLLLALPTALWLLISSVPYAAASWRVLEGSADAGGLPGVFLLKTLIPFSAALLTLQALALLSRDLIHLTFEPPA